jgi:hypothetical protein
MVGYFRYGIVFVDVAEKQLGDDETMGQSHPSADGTHSFAAALERGLLG